MAFWGYVFGSEGCSQINFKFLEELVLSLQFSKGGGDGGIFFFGWLKFIKTC